MSNWTAITDTSLQAYCAPAYLAAAQTMTPGIDQVAVSIADAVATVRAAVAKGNQLDVDPTKVPNSLVQLTARRAAFAVLSVVGIALSDDQRDDKRNDQSLLNRITDEKMRFEVPDNAAPGSAEMQDVATVAVINAPRQQTRREMTRGL